MSSATLARHRWKRAGFALLGLLLFYAPFALLVRLVGLFQPASPAGTGVADVHAACLRMSYGWLVQPWMWPALGRSALTLLPIAVLPIAAVAIGPAFCGWLCPAGAIPEALGRIVPDRFKFDFKDKVAITPLRYGLFAGFLLAPFLSASVACTFCNFGQTQNLVGALFGDVSGIAYVTSIGMLSLVLWAIVLGAFTKGGRGWCLFLCPAGTASGLASRLTRKLPGASRVRSDAEACTSCGTCVDTCSMRAVSVEDGAARVDHHLCNSCLDCVAACPSKALRFGRER